MALLTVVFAGAVYVRAWRLSHAAFRDRLTDRALAMAGALSIDHDGLEWDVSMEAAPEYMKPGSGEYFMLYYPNGEVFARSPSLAGQLLPKPAAWADGGSRYREIENGPDGLPLAVVQISFLVRVGDDEGEDEGDHEGGDWQPPPDEELRFRFQLAADTRERDAGLRGIAAFLSLAGAAVIGLSVLLGLLVSRRVLSPLRRMTAEAERLSPEDLSLRLDPDHVALELHSLAATLNRALDRLGDALDRQRRFTSDASHELRTPVSVLLANSEYLLRRPRIPEEYVEGLTRQHRTAQRMQQITEDLLTLARADAHAAEFRRESVDLGALVEAMCEEFRGVAEEKGIDLTSRATAGVRVPGDRRYLSQLATNLISNAVKFTPSGGRVEVALSAAENVAVFSVADTGPGIPEEEQLRIFDRFHRVGGGSNGTEGSGLGLAIAAWVARAHGGAVRVTSAPGEGATFTVELPRA